nr:cytochrome b6/f complex subunit V [Euglena deses]YP_010700274.1 cytochrome b6/f complex subunit V [Euglena undulata]WCH63359.1 cytochrome b6/f complex subunit V [Euglena deses]WCH63418.1 cytochrome b6/f complex subunit V [Euglena undulata]
MVETLLSGIILGLIPITVCGLFFTAYLQYMRSDNTSLN